MSYVSRERLLRGTKSLYKLALAAAARANQLHDGAKPLIEVHSEKPGTIALKEIAEGKVQYKTFEKKAKTKE